MAKTIINLDRVKAVYAGHIYNVTNSVEMENGSLVKLGGLKAGHREVFEVSAVADATADKVVVVASDEVNYDPRMSALDQFTNEADSIAKAYELAEGDVITISQDGYTGTPVVGKYLITANGAIKPAVADSLVGGTAFAGEIIALTTLGFNNTPAVRIRIVKN